MAQGSPEGRGRGSGSGACGLGRCGLGWGWAPGPCSQEAPPTASLPRPWLSPTATASHSQRPIPRWGHAGALMVHGLREERPWAIFRLSIQPTTPDHPTRSDLGSAILHSRPGPAHSGPASCMSLLCEELGRPSPACPRCAWPSHSVWACIPSSGHPHRRAWGPDCWPGHSLVIRTDCCQGQGAWGGSRGQAGAASGVRVGKSTTPRSHRRPSAGPRTSFSGSAGPWRWGRGALPSVSCTQPGGCLC